MDHLNDPTLAVDWLQLVIAAGLTLTLTSVVAMVVRHPLFGVLQLVCGTDVAAHFWTTFSAVLLVMGPLFLVFTAAGGATNLADFVRRAVYLVAFGVIGAFMVMGAAVMMSAPSKTIAQARAAETSLPPARRRDLFAAGELLKAPGRGYAPNSFTLGSRGRCTMIRLLLLLLALLPLAPLRAQAQDLRIGVQAPFGLDPQFLFLGPNMAAARQIFDSLVGRDAEARWTPSLAVSWKQLDPLTWQFKLRQGVTFQDGSPFSAADVVATFARVPSIPNNPSPYTPNLRTVAGVDVMDPYTLRIHTDRPNPTLPGQFTNIFILPAHLAKEPAEASSTRVAIGTGPYKVVSFRYGDGMTLERYDGYWGPKPAYARVQIKVISNDAAREAALLADDIDVMENVPPDDVARLKGNPALNVFSRPADRVVFLEPNTGADTLPLLQDKDGKMLPANPLRDMRVRQAMSTAIDRTALVDRVLLGQGVPSMQIVPDGFLGWTPGISVPKGDAAAARRLLAAAGYADGFRLTLACTNDRYIYDGRICQTLAQMLTRAGFATTVDVQPGSTFMSRTRADKNQFPVLLYAISLSSLRDVAYILGLVAHSRDEAAGFGDGNRGSFSDPALDKIIEAAIIRSDPGREAALQNAAKEAVARLGMIPLYTEFTIVATRAGITYTPRMDQQLVAQGASPKGTP